VAKKTSKSTRSESQIESDMAATRQRLTSSLETLIDQVHPNRVKQRGAARLKLVAAEYTEKAKGLVFNARGDLRTDRVAAAGGGLAGLVAFIVVLKRLRRGKKS
jgi:hypothetical protein